MSDRGFAILTLKNGENIHYNLEERDNGIFWVSKGKAVRISKSSRNYRQAESKAKELFRKDARLAMKQKTYAESYSSMWHEPNAKYFDQTDFDKWLKEGSY